MGYRLETQNQAQKSAICHRDRMKTCHAFEKKKKKVGRKRYFIPPKKPKKTKKKTTSWEHDYKKEAHVPSMVKYVPIYLRKKKKIRKRAFYNFSFHDDVSLLQ